MKCLPVTKIPSACGNILHDWHAEILCMRAFNHFLLQECKNILTEGIDSLYLRHTGPDLTTPGRPRPPFIWREDVTLHMYCSEAPCGDASMELTIAAQEDASPWEAPLPKRMMEQNGLGMASPDSTPDLLLLGRACFSHLGVIRRKPGRPDAPPTLSKSCSDKLAAKQCTSLLSSITSLFISPENIYLATLVMPESQYSAVAVERSFSPRGRMGSVKGSWQGRYMFKPFAVQTTNMEFAFSRRGVGLEETKFVASSVAAAWTMNGLAESIVGGVLQGRKQSDPNGGSSVSRRNMWILARHITSLVAGMDEASVRQVTYQGLKDAERLTERRQVKQDIRAEALKGWVRNIGDEDFNLGL